MAKTVARGGKPKASKRLSMEKAKRRAEIAEERLAEVTKMLSLSNDACRAFRLTIEQMRIGLLHSLNSIDIALGR